MCAKRMLVGWLVAILVGMGGACSDDSAGGADTSTGGGDGGSSSGTGSIEGVVKNKKDKPVGDTDVKVGSISVKADYQGIYAVKKVPAGKATVAFSADWYADKSASATVTAGKATSLDVTLDAKPLKLDSADEQTAKTFQQSFDWKKDTVSLAIVKEPTRRALDSAIWWLNPAFYKDKSKEPAVTPSPQPDVTSTGGDNFDFKLSGGKQALVASSIVDTLAKSGISQSAQDAFLMWDPMLSWVLDWNGAKGDPLKKVQAAVREQQWGGKSLRPQSLQKVFLDGGRIWVQISFEPFVKLGTGVTDSDNDGRVEIYAQLDTAHYDKTLYDKLVKDYVTPKLDTLGLKDALEDAVTDLYDRSNPSVLKPIGEPYQLPGGKGTIKYPFAVLKHAESGAINVLLVGGSK